MTSYEPVQAGPYLTPSDPPDLASITKLIVDWTALRGNMRFASTTTRDAAIPSPVEGMECVTGTGAALVKWLYFNAVWVRPFASAAGTIWVPITAINTPTLVVVTFPVGLFVAIPSVITGVDTANPERYHTSAAGVSATGFSIVVTNTFSAAPITGYWHAQVVS